MNDIMNNIRMLAPFLIIPWAWLIIRTIRKPQSYFNSILLMVCGFFTLLFISGLFGSYMGYALLIMTILVILALFLVPIMLIINGVQMIKKESFSFAHLLSLILGIGIAMGEISYIILMLSSLNFEFFRHIDIVALLLSATVFYWSCLMLSFVLYCIFIDLLPHRNNFNYIIIHGCGLADGHRVTKLLSNRIDKAITLYNKCKKKPYIIASGGKGTDEEISEAQAMYDYLIDHGIPAESIILEEQSTTTMENLINSKEIIDSKDGNKKTALVSSNYHIYRCLKYARTIHLNCIGIGSKVAFYFWPTAVIREFVAVFRSKKYLLVSISIYLFYMLPVFAAVKALQ